MTENDFFGGALFSGLVAGIFDKDARRDEGFELGFEHGNGIRNPSASIDGLGPRLKCAVRPSILVTVMQCNHVRISPNFLLAGQRELATYKSPTKTIL